MRKRLESALGSAWCKSGLGWQALIKINNYISLTEQKEGTGGRRPPPINQNDTREMRSQKLTAERRKGEGKSNIHDRQEHDRQTCRGTNKREIYSAMRGP